jgi:hypothetical protein
MTFYKTIKLYLHNQIDAAGAHTRCLLLIPYVR